ncbi:MAG: hypothetical protein H0W25_01610 [Acidimicrobiia bacterium]|nr:hypothetical protein [Acidimicrobiia bacterium]
MADDQDRSEALDEDKIEDLDYPPDRPLGVDEYGTTAAEKEVDEPLAQRAWREEPDERRARHSGGMQLVDNTADADIDSDIDAAETGDEMEGRLAEDDLDAWRSDEREPLPAEEAAMHVTDNP